MSNSVYMRASILMLTRGGILPLSRVSRLFTVIPSRFAIAVFDKPCILRSLAIFSQRKRVSSFVFLIMSVKAPFKYLTGRYNYITEKFACLHYILHYICLAFCNTRYGCIVTLFSHRVYKQSVITSRILGNSKIIFSNPIAISEKMW